MAYLGVSWSSIIFSLHVSIILYCSLLVLCTHLLEELLSDELGPPVVHLPRLARMRYVGHLVAHTRAVK